MRFRPFERRRSRVVPPDPASEVKEELDFHLDERVREYMSRGMDPDAARATALARLGDLDGVRRECTDLLTADRRAESRRERLRFSWLDVKLQCRSTSM